MAYKNKADQKAAVQRHYLANKPAYKERARIHTARETARVKRWLADYLTSHPCVGCGESDPIVLEFDHREPAIKRFTIKGKGRHFSLRSVIEEVKKCDIRCANCHRRRTYMQRLRGEFLAEAVSDQPSLF